MRSSDFKAALVAAFAMSTRSFATPVDVATLNSRAMSPRSVLAKRAETEINGMSCGTWATADDGEVGDGLSGDDTFFVKKGECGRVGCYNTSGVSVCNDSDGDLEGPMQEIIDYVKYLKDACNGDSKAISGQVFSKKGYNVNISFCVRESPVTTPPSDHVKAWLGDTGVACSNAVCDSETLEMESHEQVVCGAFFDNEFASPGGTVQLSTSYEVGMTVTTGGSIGISFGDLGASIEESVAESMTITNTSLSEYPCGEDIDGVFTCALLVEPTCVRMKGTCEAGDLGTVPWEVTMPTTSNGEGVKKLGVCACPNCPGTDEEDAPEVCPMDCQTAC